MNRKIICYALVSIFFGGMLLSGSVSAASHAWLDDGGTVDVSGGSTEDCHDARSSTWGNCLGIGWVYYEYYKKDSKEPATKKGHGSWTVPKASSTNITVNGNTIPNKCGKFGGFYNLGYIVNRRWKDGKVWKAKPVDSPDFQLGTFTHNGNSWRNIYPTKDNKKVKINKDTGHVTKLTDDQKKDGLKTARIWAVDYESKNIVYSQFKWMVQHYGDEIGINPNSSNKKIKEAFNKTGSFCFGQKTDDDKKGTFASRSKVNSSEWSDADGGGSKSPTKGGATAKVDLGKGTEASKTTTVTFKHLIRILPVKHYDLFKSPNPSTSWEVTQTINGKSKTTVGSGKTHVKDLPLNDAGDSHNAVVLTSKVNVTVTAKEKKKKVCQVISYNHKTFSVDSETKKLEDDPTGSNDSEACVTVTYNSTPPPDCPSGHCDVCPLPGFDHTVDYGNTVASSEVKNFNNSDWTTLALAKPGDEIQFRHTLCAGAQTVTASWSNGATRRTGDVHAANWFYLKSDVSGYGTANNYLFNRSHLQSRITFDRLSGNPSQLNQVNPEERYTGSSYYYGFRVYSPKLASTGGATSYDNNPYNCVFYDGGLAQTYQVSGFGTWYNPANCAAAKIYTSGSSALQEISRSNVGHSISQSLVYNDVKAWVDHAHNGPNCGCDRYSSASTWYVGYPGGNGYMRHTCVRNGICPDYRGYDYICGGHSEPYSCGTEKNPSTCYRWVNEYCHHYEDGDANRLLNDYDLHYPISYTDPQAQKTATVKIPYNFTTSVEAAIDRDDDIVYAGQDAWAHYNVSVYERQNSDVDKDEAYMTMTPNDTLVQLMSFTINGNIPASSAESYTQIAGISNPGENIQSYLTRTIGSYNGVSNFQIMNPERGKRAINERGELHGKDNSGVAGDYYDNGKGNGYEYSIDIPDVEVGSKFCVVVGISHADSHDIFSTDDIPVGQGANSTSLNNASSRWRISNASCRTIAKKPTFQAWGGTYTQGQVITSTSSKHTYGGGDHIFGSWTDTLAIGAGSLYQFASGAATGYSPNGGGTASRGTSYCDMIKMTISNANATLCNNNVSGQAGIFSELSNKLEQILSRYTPSSATNHPSGYEVGSDAARNEADELKNGGRYTYVNGDAYVNTPLIQTSGTRVIHVKRSFSGRSTLYINQNICAGTGTCRGTNNRLALNERNSTSYTGIEQIPQVIIIVEDGDVKIDANVTQIDAWIFAPNGNIDTCTAGRENADTCAKTIIFNGPVFAKTLTLNRTAGAYPGYNANGYASANRDLASSNRGLNNSNEPLYDVNHNSYGSATAGEIFNLRPDAYFWAYNQANHLSQATVVYMRELAPRY